MCASLNFSYVNTALKRVKHSIVWFCGLLKPVLPSQFSIEMISAYTTSVIYESCTFVPEPWTKKCILVEWPWSCLTLRWPVTITVAHYVWILFGRVFTQTNSKPQATVSCLIVSFEWNKWESECSFLDHFNHSFVSFFQCRIKSSNHTVDTRYSTIQKNYRMTMKIL